MKSIFLSLFLFCTFQMCSQTEPSVSAWLQNTTGTGTYYIQGNSTAIDNGLLYNCQLVEYSDDFVYVHTKGIPAYPTGPFPDGNPSQASDQDAIYRFPLKPEANTGNPGNTTAGNIGVFINGVSLFDYRDGVAWNPNTNALCGGPGNDPCPGGPMAQSDWNRDAIPAEKEGFDCSKAHPAMGNYHHHQNPSAFKLDLEVINNICDLYDADGLYTIDSTLHSPLIGYAYDGFPIYGAYGYKNADGTGGIVRIKSGYQLRDITERDEGPDVAGDYFLGYFREDYEFIDQGEDDYMDVHNGRFSITPEYPDGTYAYFSTVDEDWNSAYPYVVGPTFYGNNENRKVDSVDEATTIYEVVLVVDNDNDGFAEDVDCDDTDASINPDAIEIANNDIDEDCDGTVLVIDNDNDGFNSDEDCNDADANVNPGATEIANNTIDEDCDGVALVIDADNDGFNSDEDCDDADANVNPDAVEIINNNIDEDCDGEAVIIDADNDGFNSDEDCNDADANINPAALEIPDNGIDEDCDGQDAIVDLDNDGFNSNEDCDDSDANVNPDAVEIPNNTIDEDCDGEVLIIDVDNDGFNSDEDCNDDDAMINPGAIEVPNNAIDEDCDGEALVIDADGDGFNSDEDCDDSNEMVNPSLSEIPYNLLDDDCDPTTLDDDLDQDGFVQAMDCDDTNADINPDAVEILGNDIDENCDGVVGVSSTEDLSLTRVNLFPNPASELLTIQAKGIQKNDLNIQVYNRAGLLITTSKIKQGSTIGVLDIRTFYDGVYFMKITDGDKTYQQKFVVMH